MIIVGPFQLKYSILFLFDYPVFWYLDKLWVFHLDWEVEYKVI